MSTLPPRRRVDTVERDTIVVDDDRPVVVDSVSDGTSALTLFAALILLMFLVGGLLYWGMGDRGDDTTPTPTTAVTTAPAPEAPAPIIINQPPAQDSPDTAPQQTTVQTAPEQ